MLDVHITAIFSYYKLCTSSAVHLPIMSNPRTTGARAKTPKQTGPQDTDKAKCQEKKDHYSERKHKATESAGDECGESRDKPATSASDTKPAPRRANGNKQSKKQKDLSRSNREEKPSQTDQSKAEHERATACRREPISAAVSISEEKESGNVTLSSAKSPRQSKKQINEPKCESEDQSTTGKTNGIPTRADSNRRSRKQKDLSSNDKASHPKRREKQLTKAQNSNSTDSSDDIGTPHPSLVNNDLNKVLNDTIVKLKIKKDERSNASSCVNEITEKVISHLKRKMSWCADIERLTTGSYYENVKICEPDEFDVMLTIPLKRVDIQKFSDNEAFYKVALKRHPNKHPLDKFLNEDKTIRASEMLNEFRDGIKEAVETHAYKIEVKRKKPKCPAVTLQVTENCNAISIDFVLGLKVHGSWPLCTQHGFKIERWLGTKVKTDLKRQPYYLVPKYEGKGNEEHDGVAARDAWRISFSHIEKEILKRHGHTKTCCESTGQKCCRKECLKLLKYLLGQLKKEHPEKMSKFCSYHAKTTLLHACATKVEDSEWSYSQLGDCFQQLLDDFVIRLRNQDLRNFFVPSHNLLHQDYVPKSSYEFLAQKIEMQRNNNFPIF